MVLAAADLYHTGVVVPDLAEAKARLTAVAGYRWTRELTGELTVRIGDAERPLQFAYVYSLDAPHVELVREIPGTPWVAAPRIATHHLGYFCDDVAATSRRLEQCGFLCEATAILDGDPGLFAYHLDPFGVRIEIVERALISDWVQFLRDNAEDA